MTSHDLKGQGHDHNKLRAKSQNRLQIKARFQCSTYRKLNITRSQAAR